MSTGSAAATSSQVEPSSSDMYRYAFFDMWSSAESIFQNDPIKVTMQLNSKYDTVLHVAASAGSTTFVEGLLNLVIPGNLLLHNLDGMLPVHLAVLSANREIVQKLTSDNLLNKMDYKDIERLFFNTINSNMFDVAIKSFKIYPTELAIARNEDRLTALHILARRPSSEFTSLELLHDIWEQIQKLERYVKLAVDNHGNNVLHLAAHLLSQFKELTSYRASMQMKGELAWFKESQKRLPRELTTMRNNNGKRPIDIFQDEPKKLSEDKASAKGIAESGMIMAVFVATIAFAAALTVDKTNVWFFLTNAIAFFAASTSIFSFWSNFNIRRK